MNITIQKEQPKALYLLNCLSMWECFSYYGMRVLLVLFMVNELGFDDAHAFGIYALYTTLVEFGGILGGAVADKALGFRRSIVLGGLTIALGHISMSLPDSQEMIFLGLALIVVGTSLFRSNVAAFLGQFYSEKDPRRDAGYTLYYTGINIGGFLAAIFCGIISEAYGWHAGFSLAAIGMILGNITLYFGRKMLTLPDETIWPLRNTVLTTIAIALVSPLVAIALCHYDFTTMIFPAIALAVIIYLVRLVMTLSYSEKKGFKCLCVYLFFLILFYACEEQLGSSMVLFSERHVDRSTFFGTIPAASLVTFNPLTILLVGPILARLCCRVFIEPFTKIALGFGLLGTAFYILYLGGIFADKKISIWVVIVSICLLSIGELFIGPTIYAAASNMASRALQGVFMGTVTLGYSFANLLSGIISNCMVVTQAEGSISVYTNGFVTIGIIASLLAVILVLLNFKTKVFVS